ncbi:MAG TPA: DUF937 domain-containing protein [Candidatus Limnocylindrales bacterium]|nr:DUF937 domain-containing protein [Candidatus Limnocylindrales bacterium]
MGYDIASIQQVLNDHADEIGAKIGADPGQAQQAISAALPALLAGLQQQATPGSGLQQAITNDHDGSILDDIAGYLQGTAGLSPRTTDGAGILGHVFGDQQQGVQQALSSQTGLSASSIGQLLPLLAPIVMGMLGRGAQSQQGSAGAGDLGGILGGLLGAGGTGAGGGFGDILGGLLGGNRQG